MKTALTKLVDLNTGEKEKMGILYTPSEVLGQVDLWKNTFERFKSRLDDIRSFILSFLKKNKTATAICAGAGTSEYIGYCVEGLIRKNLGMPVNVFSTTRIVTSPYDIFIMDYPALLISFARSGNSPESIGAVEIADMLDYKIRHFIITCNEKGDLKNWAEKKKNSFAFCLDKGTNDKGLAMTSSFSNMVISAQMLSQVFCFQEYSGQFERIIQGGNNMLNTAPDVIKDICGLDFNRAVFLGNGSNFGTAVESHLKLQELTSGQVMCSYDTFPGLRHGPEAVINDNTVVVAYISRDPYLRKYEEDLLKELKEKKIGKAVLICCNKIDEVLKPLSDFTVEYDPDDALGIIDDFTPPIFIIIGQLFGVFKSLELGLKPDTPSEAGVINRVVKGIKVYNPLRYRESAKFETISER